MDDTKKLCEVPKKTRINIIYKRRVRVLRKRRLQTKKVERIEIDEKRGTPEEMAAIRAAAEKNTPSGKGWEPSGFVRILVDDWKGEEPIPDGGKPLPQDEVEHVPKT